MDKQQQPRASPITLFYSYAQEDQLLCNELEKHLSFLQRQNLITTWHKRQIVAGTDWAHEIDTHLNEASIILLLISAYFLASDYCYSVEMQKAMGRHERGEALVIPILLRPVDWQQAPFARLQALPRNKQPITLWPNQDEAFANVAQGIRRALDRTSPYPLTLTYRTNRKHMLKRVRSIWIDGLLEHSLHQAVLTDLGLHEQPDALHNPYRREVQETNLPAHPLPLGTSLLQVYDEAEGEVLLLGESGSGKTTLLLNLARTLVQRAEDNEQLPLPAIFPLTSWAQQRHPFATWLVEELSTRYQVPKLVGRAWVMRGQLLPLLDGLDEMASADCCACLEAINEYHQRHAGVPLVLCSRKHEYMAQPVRVQLQKAVMIQPLTEQQIMTYFQTAQGKLESVLSLLQHDAALRELATTPLMLNVLTLAYHQEPDKEQPVTDPAEKSDKERPAADLSEARQRVFKHYVERMLTRGQAWQTGTAEQIMHWLVWLATQMGENQTEFYLERLQPTWLSQRRSHQRYPNYVVGIVFGLIGLFSLGFIDGPLFTSLFFQMGRVQPPLALFLIPLLGLVSGLVGGSLLALLNGFLYNLDLVTQPKKWQ
jgi:energy-coupling factor transporter ATP-binding protein EcfA2